VGVRADAAVVVLAFIWAVAAVGRDSPDWTRRLLVFGGGPFAALELLAKLNTGIVVLALVAIATIAIEEDRRRNLAILATTFAGSLAVLWLGTGQGLGDVGDFLGGTMEIVSGYSSGARWDFGSEERQYDYVLAPALIVVAGLIGGVSTAALPWRRRAAVMLMLAIVALTAAKGAFVAHEVFHMATFYATILGVCLAFPLPPRVEIRIGALAATVGVAAAAFTTAIPGYPMTNPVENASNAVETVATLADGARLEREVSANREALVAEYAVDGQSLALLEGHSVHVDPSEAAVAWANGFEWRPLPVFQPYMAWTEGLDDRNADAVASADGPERILRQNLNAIGRYPAFESPAAMIEMLCHFAPLRTTPEWQVLARIRNRCGEPRFLSSAEGRYGEPFRIPEAGPKSAVFARVRGVQVEGVERLQTALLRSRTRQVTFDTDTRLFTFVPATGADGLLLRAPSRVDPPGRFKLAPDAGEITFLLDREGADEEIEIDFYSLPVGP
jgi:hypothetical protein